MAHSLSKELRMLIYDAISPAPRCLRMFVLEKQLQIPATTVDVFTGENRQAQYLSINPTGQTPTLKLADGTYISESVAIAEYLEELYPEPVLIGSNAKQRAETRLWWRRVELNITEFIHNAFHYAEGLDRFKNRIPVAPEAAPGLKYVAQDRLAWLDNMFGAGPYLCGDRFSAADIWLYVWLDFANAVNQQFDPNLKHIKPWFDRIAKRSSAEQSKQLLTEIS